MVSPGKASQGKAHERSSAGRLDVGPLVRTSCGRTVEMCLQFSPNQQQFLAHQHQLSSYFILPSLATALYPGHGPSHLFKLLGLQLPCSKEGPRGWFPGAAVGDGAGVWNPSGNWQLTLRSGPSWKWRQVCSVLGPCLVLPSSEAVRPRS